MIRLACLLLLLFSATAFAAGPAYWDGPGDIDFAACRLDGAGLDAAGNLLPALRPTVVLADSSLVFWTVVPGQDGSVLAGSGHDGRIWRVDRRGEAAVLADLPVEEVLSLLPDGDGVLAGCAAGGDVVRVDREGGATILGKVPGGFAWDLERAADGSVFVAGGNPAGVYHLTDAGLATVAMLPASNALDLAIDEDGGLVVTQGPGRVFRVRPDDGRWGLMLSLDQAEGRRVVRGPDAWYVLAYNAGNGNGGGMADGVDGGNGGMGGMSGMGGDMAFGDDMDIMVTADADVQPVRSALYRLGRDVPQRVWTSELRITCVTWSEQHGWLGAGVAADDGTAAVYGLDAPNGRRLLARWDGGDVLGLAILPAWSGGAVAVAQANPGRVTALTVADDGQARAEGRPLDGGIPVRWKRLTWQGRPAGEDPRFAVRTGMSPEPDDSWSRWQELPKGRDLDLSAMRMSRYLQWRADLPRDGRLDQLTISAFEPNLPPAITHFAVMPEAEIYRGGFLQGPDNASQTLEGGLQVEFSAMSREDRRLNRERAASLRPVRTLTWHATDPNEDRLVYRLRQRGPDGGDWVPVGGPTVEQVRAWDTAGLADGWYDLELTAADHGDNAPGQGLTAARVLERVPVDNTAPVLDRWRLEEAEGGFAVRLRATDAFGPLAGAEVQLPDGAWLRLDPADEVCDSNREEFAATVPYPPAWRPTPPRPWTVAVRVWDMQGNVARVEGVLR